LYHTNQGEIYIRQIEANIKIGDFVFNYYKRPYYNDKLKIKNGPSITIESGKIVELD
jgi:hypothetical protein